MTAKDDRAGLTWPGFSDEIRAKWESEADIDMITAIAQKALHIGELSVELKELTIELLAKGTLSKLYAIYCGRKVDYIMRITLPIIPLRKHLSEMATIKYVRQNTDIPVPRVVARSMRSRNKLGFEWTIMQRIPGEKLCEQWRHMSWLKKGELVRKVIKYQAQLFNNRFPVIGSLYLTEQLRALTSVLPPSAAPPNFGVSAFPYCLGQIASNPFFYQENWKINRCRGSYTYACDWLAARLRIAAAGVDDQSVYDDGEEEASCGDCGDDTLGFFVIPEEAHSPIEPDDEVSQVPPANTLAHQGLKRKRSSSTYGEPYSAKGAIERSMGNTNDSEHLDDANSNKECEDDCEDLEVDPHALLTVTSTSSRIQRLIKLLPKIFPKNGTEECVLFHHDLSDNNIFVDQDHEISGIIDWEGVQTVPIWLGCQMPKFLHSREANERPPFRTEFEDEEDENHYWRLVEEHEKTQLRAFFREEMQRVCPKWMQSHQAGSLKADFSLAVDTVALPAGATDHFERWLRQVEQGAKPLNLRSAMHQF